MAICIFSHIFDTTIRSTFCFYLILMGQQTIISVLELWYLFNVRLVFRKKTVNSWMWVECA